MRKAYRATGKRKVIISQGIEKRGLGANKSALRELAALRKLFPIYVVHTEF